MNIIIKNKMYQKVKQQYFNIDLKPALSDCINLDMRYLHLDFCKNETEIDKFISMMNNEKNALIRDHFANELFVNQSADLLKFKKFAQTLANSYDCLDFNERLENEKIICLYNPPPNSRFSRRYNKGSHKEEIDFVKLCLQYEEKEYDNDFHPFKLSKAGTVEVRQEWKNIHEELKKEFIYRPVDLAIDDWIAQQKGKPIKVRLTQMAKTVKKLDFDKFNGDLESETQKTEDDLKNSIANDLAKLARIQEEKICLQTRKIHMDLINENCFPEMAEILAKANKSNKQLDIFPVSDSDTDFDSWTDSWSSDDFDTV